MNETTPQSNALKFELFRKQPYGRQILWREWDPVMGMKVRRAPRFIQVLPARDRWPFGDPQDPNRIPYVSLCHCKVVHEVTVDSLGSWDRMMSEPHEGCLGLEYFTFFVCPCMGRVVL